MQSVITNPLINFLVEILNWSEVWALVIPLLVLLFNRKQPAFLKPVIIYLWLAFFIDLLIDVSWKFKDYVPLWLESNNYLYNIHSIVRFMCFSWFFIGLDQPFLVTVKRSIPLVSLVFLLINFTYFENFFEYYMFSSRLFAAEAALLLFFCLQYYIYKFQEETAIAKLRPDFWVVTGLSIYVVVNFPYFLFYTTLLESGRESSVELWWNFHNISFIILCIFIAKALHVPSNK